MIKKKKNLVRSPDEYTRYYGNFRGVDFSSEHTQVNERRFAYSVNMYKDYRSGEGSAIETIPGFRRRFEAPSYTENGVVKRPKINGIHECEKVNAEGQIERHIYVHAGNRLYRWADYPLSANVKQQISLVFPKDAFNESNGLYTYDLNDEKFADKTIAKVISISINNIEYTDQSYYTFNEDAKKLTIYKALTNLIDEGQVFGVNYYESVIDYDDCMFKFMNDAPSKSFVFNNDLFIIDGNNYQYIDIEEQKVFTTSGYTPTCYKGLPADPLLFSGKITDYELEQKNLLSNEFIHTYIADGKTSEYHIYDNDIERVESVYVYGKEVRFELHDGVIKLFEEDFKTPYAPEAPSEKGLAEDFDGVKVTFIKSSKTREKHENTINKCTICAEFDKRIFLSGNPLYPNNIWYCGLKGTTGRESATYFGELDVVIDGVENAPITGLIPVSDTLAALKNHVKQDGTIYFHKRMATGETVIPVTYPAERGLSGYGCLGACVNFLDDPIFISRLGVEAIGQLSVRLERAVEHRSTLIDSKLVNLDLSKAKLTEWDGYLILLVDGRIFMADSRQVYQAENGNLQYEWYYLEGIGVYENSYHEYYYASEIPESMPKKITLEEDEYELVLAKEIFDIEKLSTDNLINTAVKSDYSESNGAPIVHTYTYTSSDQEFDNIKNTIYVVLRETWDGKTFDVSGLPRTKIKAILCDDRGSFTGGEFKPANVIVNMNDNLFFGTTNGVVCSFNFDQVTADGSIAPSSYSFDNRTIYCGVATKMDNCDIPHLNKSTIKKSTVIKTKSMISSAAKVKIRTNKNGYKSIARLNSKAFSFADVDFSDFSFITDDQTIFSIREKEKNWVEKQHWIYSDVYQRPMSIHYLAFRYKISGRIKE